MRYAKNAEAESSLERVLGTLAYHSQVLATEPAPSRGSLGIGVPGGPRIIVKYRVEPSQRLPASLSKKQRELSARDFVWDQVWLKIEESPDVAPSDDYFPAGNRSGAVQMYSLLAVPVIEHAAKNLPEYEDEQPAYARRRR